MARRATWLWLLLIAAGASAQPIVMDGQFDDWCEAGMLHDDRGDVPTTGTLDLGRLWAAHDREHLHLLLETGRETLMQDAESPIGNRISLFLDVDGSAETGLRRDGLGVDVQIAFGEKIVTRHGPDGQTTQTTLNDVGLIMMPTHSSDTFEYQIALGGIGPYADLATLPDPPLIRFFLQDLTTSDRLPNEGSIEYLLPAPEGEEVHEPIALERMAPSDIRLLVHNVLKSNIVKNPEPFARYLRALRPDLICFQELEEWTVEQAVAFVTGVLPPGEGQQWHGAQQADVVTLSRWAPAQQAVVDENLICRFDVPTTGGGVRGLVLFNMHTPCCAFYEARQREHDRAIAAWRDILTGSPEALIAGNPDDAVILCGDFNMVGYARELYAVRDGDIFDNERFGGDFAPGRAHGSLVSAPLRHTHSPQTYTWRWDPSEFGPGKLDYVLFSDDALKLKRNFTLWTPEMPAEALAAAGLEPPDSPNASDHLVLVADFEVRE